MAQQQEVPPRQLLIGGKWAPTPARLPVVCPIDGSTIGSIPAAGPAEVNAAVEAAAAAVAARHWTTSTGAYRAKYLRAITDKARWSGRGLQGSCRVAPTWIRRHNRYQPRLPCVAQIKQRKSELAVLETRDMGKPIAEAEWDMDDVAGCFEFYAGAGRRGGRRWLGTAPSGGGAPTAPSASALA